LTRSLADFAKLIEVFEAHGVSFVAVTQQFNTTTSMGRLTLNVLLSFAQFERELASERIRDKFAASRRKGMWMGGTIPLGYDVKNRKLVVNREEADRVRFIFRRYLELGRVSALLEDLERRGVRSKQRILTSGQVLGGFSFRRGALYHILRNHVYRGEVVHKGVAYPGEQERIVDEDLWSAAQTKLTENWGTRRRLRLETGALLCGLIFDDRGNLMSPTYTIRRGNRYRYYVSRALVGGPKEAAGSHARISADEVEQRVVEFLSSRFSKPELLKDVASGSWTTETRTVVQETVEKVVVCHSEVEITLNVAKTSESLTGSGDQEEPSQVYTAPLPAPRLRARKEIIVPGGRGQTPRRINRALVLAIARGKMWMKDLRSGHYRDATEIAQRFKLNGEHVRRVLRFSYLAPDIVEAVVEGRQPRSLNVRRLLQGIPCAWPDQRREFGFTH
jgi:hypothetical protein